MESHKRAYKNQVASASSCGDMARTKVSNVLTYTYVLTDAHMQDNNISPAYGEVKSAKMCFSDFYHKIKIIIKKLHKI